MPHNVLIRLAAVALLCWAVGSPLGARELHGFRHFGSADGLSHNSVYALAQDHLGYIWVGTVDGLNRFDGYDFRVYRHQRERPDSLSSNLIASLRVAEDGTLWVGTANGLNRYLPEADAFRRVTGPGAPVGQVADLFSWRGKLCAIHADGLSCHAGDQWHAVALPRPEGVAGVTIAAAAVGPDGTLHLSARSADGRFWITRSDDPVRWRETAADAGIGPAIGVDRSGRIWWRDRADADPRSANDPVRLAWAFEENHDGIWVGTARGLVQHTASGRRLYQPGKGPNAFLQNFVRALLTDESGELWIGTHGGLFRSRPAFAPFRSIEYRAAGERSLSAPAVAALFFDGQALWVGTHGGGLDRVDAAGTISRFPGLGVREAPPENPTVWGIAPLAGDRLLLATRQGLFEFDTHASAGRLLEVRDPFGQLISLRAIAVGGDSRFWLAAASGLYEYAGDEHRMRWPLPARDGPRPIMTVESLLVEDDVLWLGTRENELVRFEPATDAVRSYRLERALAGEGIWQIHRSSDGSLLLGTGSGLIGFDEGRWKAQVILEPPAIPGSFVYSIGEDGAGHLWLGTNRGLVRYDPGTGDTRVFGEDSGTGLVEYNRRAVARLDQGALAFGGMTGLTRFDPAKVGTNRFDPPVVLTALELHTRDGVSRIPGPARREVRLPASASTVVFAFASLDYTAPSSNRFRYRMTGLEDEWVEAGTRRVASYSSMPPGSYVFEVAGTNSDGIWSRKQLALPVTVLPALWQTVWFRALVIAALVIAGVQLYRWRVRHLLAVERLRWRIADDLHDELSSELSGIAVTADLLQRSAPDPETRRRLESVRRTASRAVESLRDIVWYVNPDHDRGGAMVERFRTLGQRLFPDRKFQLRAGDAVEHLALPMTVRRNLYLIYKEALHNALRHSRARQIRVQLEGSDGRFHMRIADDGIGLGNAGKDGTGLLSMRRRAREIGACLEIDGSSAGTTVSLDLDLAKTRDGGESASWPRLGHG